MVNVRETGIAGYEIAKSLEADYKVVLEKYEADNIFFIAILQNTDYEAIETAKMLKNCLKKLNRRENKTKIVFPEFPLTIKKAIPSYKVSHKKTFAQKLEKSIGLICAEDIVPYPPGIPLIAKGEIIQKEHVEYLKAIKNLKGLISLVINDSDVNTILVARD